MEEGGRGMMEGGRGMEVGGREEGKVGGRELGTRQEDPFLATTIISLCNYPHIVSITKPLAGFFCSEPVSFTLPPLLLHPPFPPSLHHTPPSHLTLPPTFSSSPSLPHSRTLSHHRTCSLPPALNHKPLLQIHWSPTFYLSNSTFGRCLVSSEWPCHTVP